MMGEVEARAGARAQETKPGAQKRVPIARKVLIEMDIFAEVDE